MVQITKFNPPYAVIGAVFDGNKYLLMPFGQDSVAFRDKDSNIYDYYDKAENSLKSDGTYYSFDTLMEAIAWILCP